jgi:hypothetical protein
MKSGMTDGGYLFDAAASFDKLRMSGFSNFPTPDFECRRAGMKSR